MSRSWAASRPSSGSSDDAPGGLIARFERAAAPLAHRISESPAVRALQASLPMAFAVALAALAARLLWSLVGGAFPGWGVALRSLVAFLPDAFALASLAMVVVLALRLARELRVARVPLLAASCVGFVLALPRAAFVSVDACAHVLGVSGVFTAILVVLAAAGATALAQRRFGARTGALAGAFAIVAVAAVLFALQLSPASALATALAPLATLGDSLFALAAIVAIESVLWLVGIHGPALLAAIVFPVYLALQVQNSAAFGRHDAIPHIVVVSTFLFVFPGGAGATLPLVVMLLRSRVRRLRATAYAALVPTLFNLNEPVIFGLPVAYNPVLALPFVLAPLALACTTYGAIASGLVGRPLFYSPTTIPSIVNAFITTLDWRACVLLCVNLVVAGAIWFPFVRVYERTERAREANAVANRETVFEPAAVRP